MLWHSKNIVAPAGEIGEGQHEGEANTCDATTQANSLPVEPVALWHKASRQNNLTIFSLFGITNNIVKVSDSSFEKIDLENAGPDFIIDDILDLKNQID